MGDCVPRRPTSDKGLRALGGRSASAWGQTEPTIFLRLPLPQCPEPRDDLVPKHRDEEGLRHRQQQYPCDQSRDGIAGDTQLIDRCTHLRSEQRWNCRRHRFRLPVHFCQLLIFTTEFALTKNLRLMPEESVSFPSAQGHGTDRRMWTGGQTDRQTDRRTSILGSRAVYGGSSDYPRPAKPSQSWFDPPSITRK